MSIYETRGEGNTAVERLYVALELSSKKWLVASGAGDARRPRRKTLHAGDWQALDKELATAKKRFGLPPEAEVVSCYESGRDGHFIHRMLKARGISNVEVDAASIEVSRRKRRAKTDRLDADALLQQLVRYHRGEKGVWSVVRVPSQFDEDIRRIHRERKELQRDCNRLISRIKAGLATQGLGYLDVPKIEHRLEELRRADGAPLPPQLLAQIRRQFQRYRLIVEQVQELDQQADELMKKSESGVAKMVRALMSVRGIGPRTAWVLVLELFGWRSFNNRKEVAALAGLTGSPYNSGDSHQEQGISKAGNAWVREAMGEAAWMWVRYQPNSKMTQWFNERWGSGGKRSRKVGIVALARKLLISLWRLAHFGEIPEGAELKQPQRGARHGSCSQRSNKTSPEPTAVPSAGLVCA